ncbi:hypothetical protein DFR50_13733 [Roseiarcus fermentans]|uniref:Pyridoxamine 5'-phosphate oxidase N-terminal domain-containing protein n=1 Tax=Roseiarcus fermentans TaxID=1473586 RepID=A0A366ERN1_9HYPH|nr:pyridoxamine 5'-phosphate oxidase family protein [Roseiarcus fermentans]RBP05048.1 hypothetical protein DFR50_13733 [Roseiarcus fermentans]
MPNDDLEARRLDLMTRSTTMTLATCADDRPWATDVYFVSVGFDLWFVSSSNSRHSANLKRNPRCAATIHAPARDWTEIRGLQFEGTASRAPATDTMRLLVPYFQKFPFAEAIFAGLSSGSGLARMAVYRFAADRVWYIDNSLGFGSKYTCAIDGGNRVGAFGKI